MKTICFMIINSLCIGNVVNYFRSDLHDRIIDKREQDRQTVEFNNT